MRKYLLPILLIGFWNCEESGENYTIHDLPQQFPLDRDYAWEYERTFYENKTLWMSELQPDTTYLDTLFVGRTENNYSYYWWGNDPTYFNVVKNQDDVNHFIKTGTYYIENDSIGFQDKPSLWANYASNFDTTGFHAIYRSFRPSRYTVIDTLEDTITHSFVEYINLFFDTFESYSEKKINLFGVESWKSYYDWFDNDGVDDIFQITKKQREINISSTSMKLIKSKFDNKLNHINKLYNNPRISQRYIQHRIHHEGMW